MPDTDRAPAVQRPKPPKRAAPPKPARREERPQDRPLDRPQGRPQGRPSKADLPDARELLLASARQLLATKPPADINRLEIARLAQVDPALVRYYFGDKDRLLRETALGMLVEVRRDRAAAMLAGTSFRDRLHAYVHFLITLLAEYPFLHDLMVHLITEAGETDAPELEARLVQEPFREVCDMLDAARRAHEIGPVDPRFFYVAMIGMCSFPMRHPILLAQLPRSTAGNGPAAAEPDVATYAGFVTRLLMDGLAPPKPARSKRPAP